MRNTITKITAALSAAVLLALPTAGSMNATAAANANARYTFREVYYANPSAGIDRLGVKFTCLKTNVSVPSVNTLLKNPGFSGGISTSNLYYSCQGSCYRKGSTISGPALSISLYGNTPTSLTVVSSTAQGYAGKTYIEGAVEKFDAFLVGDINADKRVDKTDLSLIETALRSYNISNADFREEKSISGYKYKVYRFDIDDNGVINNADKTMLSNYLNGTLQKFAK